MKSIYIIGAGAIGKSLAVFLQKEGRKVVLVRGAVMELKEKYTPLAIEFGEGEILREAIEVTTVEALTHIEGIIVLTNKSFGNESLAKRLKGKTGQSPIVFLQNGLNVERAFEEHEYSSLYRSVLFATSQVLNESLVRFKPVDYSVVGIVKGNLTELEEIVETIDTAFFKFKYVDVIENYVWMKAIVNAAFNSICPLLEVDNGIFIRNELVLNLAKQVIHESVIVAKKIGVDLKEEDVLKRLLLISEKSDGQLISTYQDLLAGKPTEIASLNVEIAKTAERLSLEKQVNVTKLLGELILLKEQTGVR